MHASRIRRHHREALELIHGQASRDQANVIEHIDVGWMRTGRARGYGIRALGLVSSQVNPYEEHLRYGIRRVPLQVGVAQHHGAIGVARSQRARGFGQAGIGNRGTCLRPGARRRSATRREASGGCPYGS